MAVQHAYKPAIAPGKYGYDGGEPKSDCVEVTVRELFDLLLVGRVDWFLRFVATPINSLARTRRLYEQHAVRMEHVFNVTFQDAII
jgi:hypothetical protein